MDRRPPELLAVSRGDLKGAGDAREWLTALGAAGIDAVQLREKGTSDRDMLVLAREARRLLPTATSLLVNQRADLVVASGAEGVHLPANGIPTSAARRLLGRRALIGRSTHHLDEVDQAFDEGADYVTFGPVFFTRSKARYGPPLGIDALAAAAERGGHVLALGGITMGNADDCIRAGAHGIAAITLFADPGRLPDRVRRLRGILRNASS